MAGGKRINFPPALGGGDFVLRELKAGEFEDSIKAQGDAPKGKEIASVVNSTSGLVIACLVEFKGRPVPSGAIERDAFWRDLTAAQRSFLVGCHDRMNNVKPDEIDAFFAEGVPA